jgi:FSR family fosmidomycin resistance protein-like MFS transporter
MRSPLVATLLAIELLDELVGGVWSAAWPLVRDDLGLSYGQVGLALALPALVSTVLDPAIGIVGDSPRRRALVLGGGLAFAAAVVAAALAPAFDVLVVALVLFYPASTAFVSLAQASLMDAEPHERERNMARWTLAGSVGVVAGPLLLSVAAALAVGWRPALLAAGLAALPLVWLARELPLPHPHARASLRSAVCALRDREVRRWLVVLEASNLLLDVLGAFLALYLVDAAGADPAGAALAVAVWTGAGLAGDALLLPLLRRVDGLRWVRASAAAALALYPAFLLAPGLAAKLPLLTLLGLLNAGWYAVPQARLYAALPGASGTAIAVGSVSGLAGALVPLGLGALAGALGLGATLSLLALGPLVLLALVPRRERSYSDRL